MAKEGRAARQQQRPLLEPSVGAPSVADDGRCKFARALGSVDFHTREAGLQALATWLSRQQGVTLGELVKLWKGVFYAFWHSDKSQVQASRAPPCMHGLHTRPTHRLTAFPAAHTLQNALAERLAEIMGQLPEGVRLPPAAATGPPAACCCPRCGAAAALLPGNQLHEMHRGMAWSFPWGHKH